MSNTNCRASFVPFTAIIISLLAFSCAKEQRQHEQAPEKFTVVRPVFIDTVYNKEYVAEIQAIQNVELRARVKGFIEKIHVDEGQPVKQGQLLFTLNNREFKEQLLMANARLKSTLAELKGAEVEIKNTSRLVSKNIVSGAELEAAEAKREALQAQIEEAKSTIELAKLNLSFAEIRAPFAGVVNRIPNKAGSLLDEGTLLTTLSNNREVFAYFNISEKEYLDLVRRNEMGKHKKLSMLLADNQPFSEMGTIETIESEISKGTGNIAFRARFANPGLLLKHGSSAKVLLQQQLKNALVIPQQSTFEVQDKINVYVLDKDNVVSTKSFVPKLTLPHLYVVESGLSKDDRIIYDGIQLVKEGQKIIPELKTMPQFTASVSH
jgi:RND family efflux transporter MFP subunit